MEDGCSKRFDIETLDLRSDDPNAPDPVDRGPRPGPSPTASTAKILPPIAAGLALAHSLGDDRCTDMTSRIQPPGQT